MKIKTKKARLIAKAIVCIVLSLAILIPATMLSLAENETAVLTTPKEMSSDTLEYYDLEKGVYTNKQVTGPNADGTYNVTVDTYTSDVTYISGSTPPVDIMILLDNSASMRTLNSTEDGLKSKRDMAKTAISNVLSDLVDKYHVGEANKIQAFISLYTFSNTCTDEISLRLEYRKLNNDTKKAILNKIDGIAGNAIGGTNTGEGFERMKEKITARQAEYPDHKQILLVLTDGAPALVTSFDASGESYANTAISCANELKKNGVEIFCIGLNRDFIVDESLKEENNNDEELEKNYLKNIVNKGSHSTKARKTTLFTAVLSSAWTAKQTKSFNWNDSLWDSKPSWEEVPDYYDRNISKHCYYQGAIEGQEKITESINQAISDALSINYTSKSTLLGDYSVKDTVSSYFEIVPNSAQFYKVAYTGMKENFTVNDIENPDKLYGAKTREFNETEKTSLALEYTETSSTIEVLATDKNSSLVDAIVVDDLVDSTNEKHSGNKLRISYKIRPKDSFMGGSSVPTHDYANSGIYKGNEVVQSFDKANSSDTNPVPKMSVELVRPTKITANSNVKIGFLYSAENVGNTDVNVTYQGRYSVNGAYNSYIMNADSGIVYDKDGTEISYGSYTVENDKDDDKTKGTATSGSETDSTGAKTTYFILPSDYACLMYGKTSKTDNSIGVVENSGYIQFNSTGISLNGKTYSSEDVTVDKIYYLGWSEYNQFDKYGNNTTISRFENYVSTGIDNDAVISNTLNKGIAKYSETDNLMLFVQGQRAVEQFTGTVEIDVHVPTVTVNDAVWTTAVGTTYTEDLKNFVPTTINTTEFKLPTLQGGKITYKTTASEEFITPIDDFNHDLYVVSYVTGYADKDGKTKVANAEIEDGDQLKIALEYIGSDGQSLVRQDHLGTEGFEYTFDAFEAINQCSYCANSYTPQFLGYSAQVHKEENKKSKFITVKKEGAYDDTDSFVFGVYGYKAQTDGSVNTDSRKLLGTFVVHGNNTQTVSVTMADYDYFSVEENLSSEFNKGWSWNYSSVDVSCNNSAQVSQTTTEKGFPIFSFAKNSDGSIDDGANVMLTFKNTYDTSTEKIASDSTWCINVIKSDSITRMTEDGTETFAKSVTENAEATTVAE